MLFIYAFVILTLGLTTAAQAQQRSPIDRLRHANPHRTNENAISSPRGKRDLPKRQHSRFLNNNTRKFVVNGSALPEVDFDVGESYAGLLPIGEASDESRQLWFWFFPSTNPAANNEITVWLNGGPGCSSMTGLITENGPFLWQDGTTSPFPNSYSWTNLTNMIWIDQPIGVGYTQGVPNITNDVELGLEFAGFWRNFIDAFEMHGFTTYLTGESFAGYYLPYIADAFVSAANKSYYNLGGVAIGSALLGDRTVNLEVTQRPLASFLHFLIPNSCTVTPICTITVHWWAQPLTHMQAQQLQPFLNLNDSYMNALDWTADFCNFSSYLEQYYKFPPPAEPFPVLPDVLLNDFDGNYTCYMYALVFYGALDQNPCYNAYHVTDICPFPVSALGNGPVPREGEAYFNRTDVKTALHAPAHANWTQCTPINVYGDGSNVRYNSSSDHSLGPSQNGVLSRVIEYTNNVILGNGGLDTNVPANGTLLALQNMTWHGVKGFQAYPQQNHFYVPYHTEWSTESGSGAGYVGYWGEERNLTFFTVQQAGHQIPQYAPGAAYRMLEKLLGRISSLGEVSDFTTQSGNLGNNASAVMSMAMV